MTDGTNPVIERLRDVSVCQCEDRAATVCRLAIEAADEIERLQAALEAMPDVRELVEALELFVAEYVELVDSGDAGFWDAEAEPKVIKARVALAKVSGAQCST